MLMEHPFVGNLREKTLEELQEAISGLNKKINYAARINHQHMMNQLSMALNTYRAEYSRRQAELLNKKTNSTSGDLGSKIDIN